MYQSKLYIYLRRLARKTGLLPSVVSGWRKLFAVKYEQSFNQFMQRNINPDDVIWDVGANQGQYVEEILVNLSNKGKVVTFEPAPTSAAVLYKKFINKKNVTIINAALSDKNGEMTFYFDPAGSSSVEDSSAYHPDKDSCVVRQFTGASFAHEEKELFPNCIKIDVEGFEVAVIEGLKTILSDRRLRCLFIEVHFRKLDSLGYKTGASQIFDILKSSGFKTTWTDPSHLCAVRVK
ncbi:FkbM family methyltransferase [Limnobacter sp. CACIAM 66H1]|uniref:FkbM family methyltransferase n=1 Tax=Limnobacter sp. CACIAM 66H1 TaxID=1813033 RepID=UPI0025C3D814|nr:FkbM family methyltransferase [Limnobacter sp. CACIAM 66H1]